MRSREFVAGAAIVLAAAVFSLAAAGGVAALSSRESPEAPTAGPSLTKPIYCPDGANRQFSNIYHAWSFSPGVKEINSKSRSGFLALRSRRVDVNRAFVLGL
jgi:hypothetical protein